MNPVTQIGHIAAFFDLDGTLVPSPSLERRFFTRLRKSGAIPFGNYLRYVAEAARLLPKGTDAVLQDNKSYLRGVWCDQVYQHAQAIAFFEDAIARVAWHARQGHIIVLVSGTLEPLAEMAALGLSCELEALGIRCEPLLCATRMEEKSGRWTGRVVGEAMHGQAKARAAGRIAREKQIDLRLSHAYGNSPADCPMLAVVGHAHAVNPGPHLAATANQLGWTTWRWRNEVRPDRQETEREQAVLPKVESRA